MSIDPRETERIAGLARLALSKEEVARFSGDLTRIVEYVAQIQGCDTEGVSAEIDPGQTENVLRDDVPVPSLPHEEALKNAPDTDGLHFRVPPVLPSTEH
jgi:aspartyl-tRNA(Asn)/glutamyl-tRNA(Gln) amidotransferase subunit C